jgi:hypothetical protein
LRSQSFTTLIGALEDLSRGPSRSQFVVEYASMPRVKKRALGIL